MALDLAVARAVARTKLLERALHDSGPWEIDVNGVREQAIKLITPSRVVFLATYPPLCWVDPPECVWLICRGEYLDSRPIIAPAGGVCRVEWSIGFENGKDLVSA